MCGIAGVFYLSRQGTSRFQAHHEVLAELKHRGPDHSRHHAYPSADLYHSRLMILDLTEAGHQPMHDEQADSALVFNGEIFNYRELIRDDMHLHSTGDAEVLLNLIKKEGTNSLQKLNGFFAFAYLNNTQHELLLVRDRLGVKPLYYLQDQNRLYFASELRALLRMAGKQELNHEQLYTYFRLNYCAGEERIFKNVRQLAPGHYLKAGDSGVEVAPWYSFSSSKSSRLLPEILEDAVKLRLQADVPVGSFLSGGLDSSIISAIAAKQHTGIHTFSIGFKSHAYLDESKEAEAVATHIGSEHHSLMLSDDDFINRISEFMHRMDEPFADSSAFNLFLLSEFSRKHVKVALSGDGADELFKGYLKHKALLWSRKPFLSLSGSILAKASSALPSSRENKSGNRSRQLKKFAELRGLTENERIEILASIRNHEECIALLKQNSKPDAFRLLFNSRGGFSKVPDEDRFDLQVVLAEDMLVKTDRFSMCHGLELRNPFLDYRLVEHALNLELSEKINLRKQKIALRKHFAHLLPAETLKRGKKGFELPLLSWLRGALRGQLENSWLNEDRIRDEGLLDVKEVIRLKHQLFSSDPADSAAKIWAIIVFEQWLQNFQPYIRKNA